jgi:hypothetical protein
LITYFVLLHFDNVMSILHLIMMQEGARSCIERRLSVFVRDYQPREVPEVGFGGGSRSRLGAPR